MEPVLLLQQLAISLLLGLLVGLQRERTDSDLAGFRTFPLITTFGTLCAILGEAFGYPWIMAAGFAGIISLILIGNIPKLKMEKPDPGVTTEIAMLVMFSVGAFVVVGEWIVAVAVAGGVAILLQLKPQLHGLAARMGDHDFRAILQFVLVTFIVLPVLKEYDQSFNPFQALTPVFPNINFDNLDVLNPYEVWLMVVLVVSISLGGYVSYKIFGRHAGIVLGGILGGTISSTATTMSYSRRTAQSPDAAGLAAIVIMIASAVTYVRVLLEIAVVAPSFLIEAAGPILVMFAASVVLAAVAWIYSGSSKNEMPVHGNPTELKSAIIFGLLYALVIVAVAVGREKLNDEQLYAIAGLSGMTDMDAITLSTSRLVRANRLEPHVGWRLIVIAAMSNLFFKGLIVAVVGHSGLLKKMRLLFGIALITGFGVLFFWGG